MTHAVVANLGAYAAQVYDLVRFVEEHRRNNTFLQLFARSVTGAFDAEWKYVVRVQQYSHALHPTGFANIGTVQNFFIRQLYPDQVGCFPLL
jgi:hypothetical protein